MLLKLVILTLLKYVCAVNIKYVRLGDVTQTFYNVNSTESIITEKVFDEPVWRLLFEKYNRDGDIVERIENFTSLSYITIEDIEQDFIPVFTNLPEIHGVTMKGNDITYVKTEALGTLPAKEIYLTNNRIRKIEPRSFGPEVRKLHLSCNELETISENWFQDFTVLEELDISGNNISVLTQNTFENFDSLVHIVLSHNKISKIEPDVFSNRANFNSIHLDHNNLLALPSLIFKFELVRIKTLYLHNNRLSFLSEDFMRKIKKQRAVIYGNPWMCPCYLKVKKWLSENVNRYFEKKDDYDYEEYMIMDTGFKRISQDDYRCRNTTEREKCSYRSDFQFIEDYEKRNVRESEQVYCQKKLKMG